MAVNSKPPTLCTDLLRSIEKAIAMVIYVSFAARHQPKKQRWSSRIIHTLARDLVLVASGIRTACLVDCVCMAPSDAQGLLLALRGIHRYIFDIRAICLQDDLFFINRAEFFRELAIDTASDWKSRLCIDVTPQCNVSDPSIVPVPKALKARIDSLCFALMSSRENIANLQVDHASLVPMAGLLLNYPVLYCHLSPSNMKNLLASKPIYVYEVSIVLDSIKLVIAQFSAPKALHHMPLVRARCLIKTKKWASACDVSEKTLDIVSL
ncbi:hypothetical protein THRCLA_21199 [Thraustotheca clavata]|uniref:Uncharacterized protein n=1 Tax=Thraustotheca clavata TaxID=74557 RepID=A0A1V9ZZ77_9STRA|nr:hypothetical protein THRCLA_21199 [Thraustotheca clavata]